MKKVYFSLLVLGVIFLFGCSVTEKKNSTLEQQQAVVQDNTTGSQSKEQNQESDKKEEVFKGWFVFYTNESDIKNTNLKLNTYYLVKKDDINKDFTFTQFNSNKSAIELLELEITSECSFLSSKSENSMEAREVCLDSIASYPTGLFGDRVTVSGTMDGDKLFVNNLELNSNFPVENW